MQNERRVPGEAGEEQLAGGNASGSVVRVGDTVRKAWTASTPSVVAFVDALRVQGIDAPEPRGRDERGRQVTEFVDGPLAIDAGPLDRAQLHRVGAMVRRIHDAAAEFTPADDARWETAIAAPGAELVCHNDHAPWNLVLGERWVFIDWDAAAPSTRVWDLAYAAQSFALGDPGDDVDVAAGRLRAFVDGYGASAVLRGALPDEMTERVAAMHALLETSHRAGREPWATMFVEGHGAYWAAVHDFVDRHRLAWARALS
ncbi:phosphotransferase [Microbacterium sp. cf332]|uniref:phosphotransferase n=1 Tax=Microbacterium sp. cf332 TaxID=1761804 RepID=UPI000889CAC9|nr:phosphotransferase [Microbacterium sp. cf332]SDQ49048.1 Phosphotransferase enzyme family protein [Microbacterium sp. cf332]